MWMRARAEKTDHPAISELDIIHLNKRRKSPTMHVAQKNPNHFKRHTSVPSWAWLRQRKGCRCEGHMPEIFRNTSQVHTWVWRGPHCIPMLPSPQQFSTNNGSPSQAKPGGCNFCTPRCPTQGSPVFKKTYFLFRRHHGIINTFGFELRNWDSSWSFYVKINNNQWLHIASR